jgi:hypothetical protein
VTGAEAGEPAEVGGEPAAAEMPTAAAAPLAAVVEPLRGEPAAPAGESSLEQPVAAESVAALTAPLTAASAAFASWADADPATRELTAVILRGRELARDLQATDLRLRVARTEVPIAELGGSSRAPLLLGVAVDGVTESGTGWSGGGGQLEPLVERTSGGRGRVFFAASGQSVGEWDDALNSSADTGASGGDVASLIVASLARFDGMRGRRFLLVVTDGRNEPDKAAWQQAVAAAGEAGTPVLVVALWDEGFSQRTRKNLREIAEVSGGSLFLVQGSGQLDRAAERFGPLLDAGVAVRFRLPEGVALPAPVALESPDRELAVSAPRAIR